MTKSLTPGSAADTCAPCSALGLPLPAQQTPHGAGSQTVDLCLFGGNGWAPFPFLLSFNIYIKDLLVVFTEASSGS